ncbi:MULTISPECIES: SH3 domain-containing protein [Streptomyces]|uniref:SH3 domain-containing protein n=1 Tax=Streptomyces lavenduligriseus TaxID=67315 RepID=A0ABT0P4K4_9ACTN|nr:SH3 domain-containing protein [Streptomyces lavenduligriseus]MCL3998669.1 SH3 domain-containing protein [Streptomyces lavenduligriseus]WDM14807.1 SH3 domain-containing protein [Streptomyces lavenduligriseus]
MSVDTQEAGGVDEGRAGLTTQAAAAVRTYAVAPGVRLNVRSGPGTQYNLVRVLPEGVRLPIYCQTPGTTVSGPYGTTNIWDLIDNGEYVSDAYVHTGSDGYIAPRCG